MAFNSGSVSALFGLKINGMSRHCLWDTGATVCLISEDLVARVGLSRKTFSFNSVKRIAGVSNNYIHSTKGVIAPIRFQDDVERLVECIVCQVVPHDLIIGLNFMREHSIMFKPCPNRGFVLIDEASGKTIASTGEDEKEDHAFQVNEPTDLGIPVEKSEDATKLHPLLQKAFNCHLKDKTIDEVLNALCKEGKYVIDDEDLSDKGRVLLADYKCHFVSVTDEEVLNATLQPAQSHEAWPLSIPQQKRLDDLLEEYKDIFAASSGDVGKANFEPVHIKLLSKAPISVRNYRTPLQFRDWLRNELQELKGADIIEESDSSYSSPALVVPKKLDKPKEGEADDGTGSKGCRLVIDYRKVNEILEDVNFPIPRIQDLLLNAAGKKVFSAMDIRHAFFTIELAPESRKVTAFSCEFGKFQFKFLPQGLKISPSIFQQKIHHTLAPYEHSNPYIDDIFSGSEDIESHFPVLREVFEAMRRVNFKLKRAKCLFFMIRIPILGMMLSGEGVGIDPEKIAAIERLVACSTVAEVRTLLGFTGFLRNHVDHYADVICPIQDLVVKGGSRNSANIERFWDAVCDKALELLKDMLRSNQVLAFPDKTKPYELFTDASGRHMSGVLMQLGCPIGYFAKSFKGTQLMWAALTKEAHAVYRSVEFFSVFIICSKVILRCDHKPLKPFLKGDTRNQMVNRWSINMQQYDIEFEWVATDENISDCLSRLISSEIYQPHEECADDFEIFPKYGHALTVLVTEIHEIRLPRALTNMDMAKVQGNNAYCQRIMSLLGEVEDLHEKFTIQGGLLYRVIADEGKPISLALVIPAHLGFTAIFSVHIELLHPGMNKMLETLRRRVYWKGMAKQIRDFVSGCPTCQIKVMRQDSYSMKHDDPPLRPWMRMAIDIAGAGYGPSPRGNVAVLTALCLHSQYPFAVPIPDKKASSVVRALSSILGQVTTCKEILSDNGLEFRSKEVESYLAGLGIKQRFTAPYCPESNGVLERWHKFMNQVVRICERVRDDNEWEPAVEGALKAYRAMPHTSTGKSPHSLVFGQEPVLNLDRLMPTLVRTYNDPTTAEVVGNQLKIAFGLARKNVCLARKRSNKNVPTQEDGHLKVGDLVTVKHGKTAKSASPWVIGYKIVEMESDRTAQVEHCETGKKHRVSVKHLKKTEPLTLLMSSSEVDLYPGSTRLYLSSDELIDLNWPKIEGCTDLDDLIHRKIIEAARDRSRDTGEQVGQGGEGMSGVKTRSGRKVKPKRDGDFVYMSAPLLASQSINEGVTFIVDRMKPVYNTNPCEGLTSPGHCPLDQI